MDETGILQTLDDVKAYIDRARQRVLALAAQVPPADWRRKPAPGRWSVLDNLEHLVLTERFSTELLERMLQRARREGRTSGRGTAGWVDARPVMLEAARRVYTAPVWAEPRGRWSEEEIASQLALSRRELESLLQEFPAYDVERVVEPHPLYGWPFNAAQWVHFVGLHEDRHARQLRRLALRFGAGESGPAGGGVAPAGRQPGR
ncbi:MAG TPA: DinB family protein [Thermaerobacter sp.]